MRIDIIGCFCINRETGKWEIGERERRKNKNDNQFSVILLRWKWMKTKGEKERERERKVKITFAVITKVSQVSDNHNDS